MSEKVLPKPYSVSELTDRIRAALEGPFAKVYLEGEISGWRLYPSGHAYFTLKDATAQVSVVMFSSSLARCRARNGLKDGAKVVLYGNVTVYAPRGNYQFVALAAKLAGAGELMQRYLELKAKLEGEGLFDAARKRPLPFLPRRIGIVTSEAGAVIHDMCTVLLRRFPNLHVRLFPALVQGADAPRTLTAGLAYFDALAADPERGFVPDLVIIARGGGSFEDLFCFNDETLVRAVAASRTPVVSAVGHETDYTLCDFAADRRAGTPSIAAELAVPVMDDLVKRLDECGAALVRTLSGRGDFFAQRIDQLSDALGASLERALLRSERALAALGPRLAPALRLQLQRAEARLQTAAAKLDAYSPYGVLARGYSLTTRADGTVVSDAASLKAGDELLTRFAKGTVSSRVENRENT